LSHVRLPVPPCRLAAKIIIAEMYLNGKY